MNNANTRSQLDPAAQRQATLKTLEQDPFDVLVIGGGIVGTGVARDAAMRGLRVALFEQNDLGSGAAMASSHLMHGDFIAFDQLLNPDALMIGFARRFATYKRAPLVFQQLENIVRLTRDPERPIQFIFAGKAHPRDDEGKRYIQYVIHLSKYSDLKGHLVFLENYDIHVARQMVSGCDVWLNTPRRPLEASGTSGMKSGTHGSLNLSILDGWWREGYDGSNGFAIGEDAHASSVEEQDKVDSANLYKVLTQDVIPLFFQRDAQGIPRQWIQRIRRAVVTLVPQFTTARMVREYTEKYYLPKT